jgi:N6-adenosine-specific RNA methylase IME4
LTERITPRPVKRKFSDAPYIEMEIPFPDKLYDIIYVDPPWTYKSSECLTKETSILNGKLNKQYKTMTMEDIAGIPILDICKPDCLVYMWVVGPMKDDCIDILKRWGFTYNQEPFIWDKQHPNPGYYTITQCESIIVGKRGKIPQPRGIRNARQLVSEKRSKVHSQKPKTIRETLHLMHPLQDKIELFAREIEPVSHWDLWGLEVPNYFMEKKIEKIEKTEKVEPNSE